MQNIKILFFFLFSLLALNVQAKPLNVVVTTGMVADMVKAIGAEQVEVTALMGPGVDPHLYKATQGDLRRLLKADVVFYNGLHLEGKMQEVFDKMARKKAVFALAESLPENRLRHFGQQHDPHIWFDVSLWRLAGESVLKHLSEVRPQQKMFFKQQAEDYFKKLDQLHLWTKNQISTIPQQQRVLITAHDAFGYFGQAYDIEVRGLQGISTATEFGIRDLVELKQMIVARGIKSVFVESSVPKKYIESLVKGVEAESDGRHQLTIGGELFSDAMGQTGSFEGTYLGMVTHNVNTIVGALK